MPSSSSFSTGTSLLPPGMMVSVFPSMDFPRRWPSLRPSLPICTTDSIPEFGPLDRPLMHASWIDMFTGQRTQSRKYDFAQEENGDSLYAACRAICRVPIYPLRTIFSSSSATAAGKKVRKCHATCIGTRMLSVLSTTTRHLWIE